MAKPGRCCCRAGCAGGGEEPPGERGARSGPGRAGGQDDGARRVAGRAVRVRRVVAGLLQGWRGQVRRGCQPRLAGVRAVAGARVIAAVRRRRRARRRHARRGGELGVAVCGARRAAGLLQAPHAARHPAPRASRDGEQALPRAPPPPGALGQQAAALPLHAALQRILEHAEFLGRAQRRVAQRGGRVRAQPRPLPAPGRRRRRRRQWPRRAQAGPAGNGCRAQRGQGHEHRRAHGGACRRGRLLVASALPCTAAPWLVPSCVQAAPACMDFWFQPPAVRSLGTAKVIAESRVHPDLSIV